MQQSQVYQRLLDGSLRAQRELALALFGTRGAHLVADWLDDEFAKVDDPAYARLFTDHVSLPGVAPQDYAHRVVETSRGALLGGIRFYGRDVTRPFVEVVGHDFDDLDALRDCVQREWSPFAVRFARLRARPGALRGPQVLLDNGVHLARYRDMPAPDGRVSLAPFEDVDAAIAAIRRRYERLAGDDPTLARNVSPADPDDVREWHSAGQLQAIMVRDGVVGVFAVAPGRVGWIDADEINEEVVDADYAGHGYAASAQRAWASRPASHGDRMLVGTVDRLNEVSRRTAERAGRPRVLEDVFLLLP
jgi:RimJ/RimL family protein N-acetyltransferase